MRHKIRRIELPRLLSPFALLFGACTLLLATGPMHLSAQRSGPDYTKRARPELDPEARFDVEKWAWQKYVLGGPISRQSSLFLNVNMIVENDLNPLPQNESSIAISPIDPSFLISSAVDARPGAWVYISNDGGESWRNQAFGLVHDDWQTGNDPSVGFDHEGNAYVMYGAFPTPSTGESGVYVAKSEDGGATWNPHIPVIEHVGQMTPDSAFEDKYYIEIDMSDSSQYQGWMYTPWKRVTDRDSATQIVFSRSTDGGLTWSMPVSISRRKSGTSTDITFGQSFPIVKTGPVGQIYAVWNDGTARSIGFASSTDGGSTWSEPSYPVQEYEYLGTERYLTREIEVIDTIDPGTPSERYDTTTVTDTTDKYHVLKETFRAETYPTIAVDNTNGPRRGDVYVCWSSGRLPDIWFIKSTDGGATWSEPKRVHPPDEADQWWPWISVDQSTGDIAVMYSDSRDDPNNIEINTYVSYSSDGGESWIDRRATDAVSDFRDNPYLNQVFAGDYSGNAFHEGKIYPSFLDTREDNDVYTAVISINQPYPVDSLRVGNPDTVLADALLQWVNPPFASIYEKPISDYNLLVYRDGDRVAELDSGTTQYLETGLSLDSTYVYDVIVATESDTSVKRTVEFTPGAARLPGVPVIVETGQFSPDISFRLGMPTVRADSVTPYGNLAGLRVYRDGQVIDEMTFDAVDTGRTVSINDAPQQTGYYRYWFTTFDANDPSLESPGSDTVAAFAGPLTTSWSIDFDGDDPRLLATGTWARTDRIARSLPNSWTDSPDGNYDRRISYTSRVYPVLYEGLPDVMVQLTFDQIAIVRDFDSALVEVSVDTGRSWSQLASYLKTDFNEWADGSADENDWKNTTILWPDSAMSERVVLFRFRMATNHLGSDDGWYIDNVHVNRFVQSVGSGELAHESAAQVVPNPASGMAWIVIPATQQPHGARSMYVDVFDMIGRKRVEITSSETTGAQTRVPVDLSSAEPGRYIWRAVVGDRLYVGTIVVAR